MEVSARCLPWEEVSNCSVAAVKRWEEKVRRLLQPGPQRTAILQGEESKKQAGSGRKEDSGSECLKLSCMLS